jgi:hypothetical protein
MEVPAKLLEELGLNSNGEVSKNGDGKHDEPALDSHEEIETDLRVD